MGHIHFSYENPNTDDSIKLIKAFDLFLGLQSVLLDSDIDRRSMYGKAGCYRFKDYGLEYRVLSNFWLNTNETISWVWDNVQKATEFVNNEGIITNEEQIIEAINTSNKELAIEILSDYNIEVPKEVNI